MGVKRAVRDLVFLFIAYKLLTSGSSNFILYGLFMAFFTVFFYLGRKY